MSKPLLTERQRQVLDVMRGYQIATGLVCTTAYIAEKLGVHFTTVSDHLAALHKKGYLRAPAPGRLDIPKPPPLPIPPPEEPDPEPVVVPVSSERVAVAGEEKAGTTIEKIAAPGEKTSAVIVRKRDKAWKLRVVRSGGVITGLVVDDSFI